MTKALASMIASVFLLLSHVCLAVAQMQLVDQPKSAVVEDQTPRITILHPESLAPLQLDKTFSDLLIKNGVVEEPEPQPEIPITLDIIPRQSRIWNPNSKRFDAVELRAYQKHGDPISADLPYVAPVLIAVPGQTVRLGLNNLLPSNDACNHTLENMNEPNVHKCYNFTNNHFHGGWVSPQGIGDNVFRVLAPNANFTYEYEYNIPADHPAGTFWYHPHVHGATAIQVGSGMAGALIIKGNRAPEASDNIYKSGDIDVLLKQDGTPIPDKTFLLQQIQYACRKGADGSDRPGDAKWDCDQGVIGKLDGYDLFVDGRPQWDASKRFTTVNGVVNAPMRERVTVGKPERWRFIHAGFADSIRLQIFKRKIVEVTAAGVPDVFEAASAAQQDEVIRRECEVDGPAVPLLEIAEDGITRTAVLETDQRILHPGYRSDLLVMFSEPGEYCVLDMDMPEGSGVIGTLNTRRLLFTVNVDGNAIAMPAGQVVQKMLIDAAQALPSVGPNIRQRILDDLNAGMQLSLFVPHKSLASEPKSNDVTAVFSLFQAKSRKGNGSLDAPIGAGLRAVKSTEPSPDVVRFSDHQSDVLRLVLGDVDEWTLSVKENEGVGHPFHIHVNPFEIISVVNNAGQDLTQDPKSQYYRMAGVWKDTIFVEPNARVKFRTKYERYIGDFVIHCHILFHEDEGMMQRVSIVDFGTDLAAGLIHKH
ncbi:multicopper oxidase family protein [Rhizobium leguminosarum]|uniref:multicopper oxidase family protein n=1 Tax=Rhizobium leguminosarum TaxID=384 RepID=UPI001C95D755|nr:multicopper oxidase family protein [Rhizobium leguminosarum]MBY5560563.1 multicopper oxidase domain-containing protein [Rhizobium leguminosarum]MBY5708915.1 multicopper oxidase domain-containing protein [Rhizobium leguminosarum]